MKIIFEELGDFVTNFLIYGALAAFIGSLLSNLTAI